MSEDTIKGRFRKWEADMRTLGNVVKKLNPARFSGMSAKMAAILGQMLGQAWADPELTDLCITSEGLLLGQCVGSVGINDLLGTEVVLQENIKRLVDIPEVGLTDLEKGFVWNLYHEISRC